MPIKLLVGRQILDQTGRPTVEVDLVTELGLFRIGVPSTDLPKKTEGVQIRDDDPRFFHGEGVLKAVKNINTIIAPELIKQNLEVTMQTEIDKFLIALDGTESKCRLGSNAILAVSLVVCKAGAAKKGYPLYRHISDLAKVTAIVLPVPHFTILTGGSIASNQLPYQEYMVMPTGAASFAEALRLGSEIYQYCKKMIKEKYGANATYTSDSGGFAIPLETHREALVFLTNAIKETNNVGKVEIALNVIASDMYKDGNYDLEFKKPNSNPQDYISPEALAESYLNNMKEFPVCSVEDGFDWEDWGSYTQLGARMGPGQLLGNDLTQTNLRRVELAVEKKAGNAMAVRINQSGTVTELIECFKILKDNKYGVLVEDRWGDTDDLFLADLAVGLSAGQIKCGAPAGCRVGKYNQVLRIEEELGALSKYAGKNYRGQS